MSWWLQRHNYNWRGDGWQSDPGGHRGGDWSGGSWDPSDPGGHRIHDCAQSVFVYMAYYTSIYSCNSFYRSCTIYSYSFPRPNKHIQGRGRGERESYPSTSSEEGTDLEWQGDRWQSASSSSKAGQRSPDWKAPPPSRPNAAPEWKDATKDFEMLIGLPCANPDVRKADAAASKAPEPPRSPQASVARPPELLLLYEEAEQRAKHASPKRRNSVPSTRSDPGLPPKPSTVVDPWSEGPNPYMTGLEPKPSQAPHVTALEQAKTEAEDSFGKMCANKGIRNLADLRGQFAKLDLNAGCKSESGSKARSRSGSIRSDDSSKVTNTTSKHSTSRSERQRGPTRKAKKLIRVQDHLRRTGRVWSDGYRANNAARAMSSSTSSLTGSVATSCYDAHVKEKKKDCQGRPSHPRRGSTDQGGRPHHKLREPNLESTPKLLKIPISNVLQVLYFHFKPALR